MRTCVLAIVALLALASPAPRGRADGRLRALRDGPGVPDRARERGDRRAARAAGGGEHGRGRVPPGALAGRSLPRLRTRATAAPARRERRDAPAARSRVGGPAGRQDPAVPARGPRDGAELHAAQRGAGAGVHLGASARARPGVAALGGGGDAGAVRAPRHEQSARGSDWSPGRPHAESDPADPARGGDPAAAERAHHQRRVQRHVLLAALRPLPDARATRCRIGRAAEQRGAAHARRPGRQRGRSAHGHSQDGDVRQPGEPHRTSRAALGQRARRVRGARRPRTDLLSVPFPASTTPDVAPAPITTAASERMPAWSPDGLQLGFVRTIGRAGADSASTTSRPESRRSSTRSSTSGPTHRRRRRARSSRSGAGCPFRRSPPPRR